MKTLLILRHAKSSWSHPGLSDHDRPLNKRGKRDAPRMGQLLREEGLLPDLIISSSAKRAKTTAERVSNESGYVGHNPSMEELVEILTGEYQRFPTAALAQVELPIDQWGEFDEDIEGKLVNLWLPKEL